jgi:hypothetical protein
LAEGLDAGRVGGSGAAEITYPRDFRWLLRLSHVATECENKNNQRAKRFASEE